MKVARLLARCALLLVAAAALVGLTEMYGSSAKPPLPSPRSQAERLHRPSAPQIGYLPEFIGEGLFVAIFAGIGRLVFRLRLSPASCSEKEPALLDFHRAHRAAKASQ